MVVARTSLGVIEAGSRSSSPDIRGERRGGRGGGGYWAKWKVLRAEAVFQELKQV